jgi:secondary thiamine-phosphate synthase enzyme
MTWIQKTVRLKRKPRGVHIVTDELLRHIPEISGIKTGMANFFLQHTSASLSINENVSGDVRGDMERFLNKAVPEDMPYFRHTYEGPDDMPAHVKSTLVGVSLNIPVTGGELNLGTWQGIYLLEHRDDGGERSVVITVWGE